MKTLAALIAIGLGLSACVSPYGTHMGPASGVGYMLSRPSLPVRDFSRCQTSNWRHYPECRDYRPQPRIQLRTGY